MDRGKPLDSSGGRPEFPPGDAAAPRLTSELPRSRQGSRLRGHVAASPPRSTASPLSRHEGLAKLIRDMARIAHERPCRRYRRLIARELAGFICAIARQVQPNTATG